jgi:hypothetical protein
VDNGELVDSPIDAAIYSSRCRSSFWIKNSMVIVHSSETALHSYLSGRPNTIVKQSKYSHDQSKKYEYHCCSCGYNYHLLIVVDVVECY